MMKNDLFRPTRHRHPLLGVVMGVVVLVLSGTAAAHSGSAVLDPSGNVDTFTALARITCSDDGTGPAAKLVARIRDKSPPVEHLYLNLQLLKGTRAISISDVTPGDANYTPFIELRGGNGTYYLILNKTMAGVRDFDLEWHCMTADNLHTGTDIIVDQYE